MDRRLAPKSEDSGLGEIKEVCTKCLEDDPRNKSLLRVICMKNHRPLHKIAVWWREEKNHLEVYDESMPGKISRLRPMPRAHFEGKFRLCDWSRCRGDTCRFAHSIDERELWNAQKLQQNDESIKEGRPFKEPEGKKIMVLPKNISPTVMYKHPKMAKECTPARTIANKDIPNDYEQRFLALLNWEQDAHVQELQRKCDGQYTLVIDRKVNSMMNPQEAEQSYICGYIDGLDGDQIAYCTQASEAIDLRCHGPFSYRAKILRANNRRIDNRLYVSIVSKINTSEREIKMTATFILKHLYFDRLRNSVSQLSKNADTIRRLRPKREHFVGYQRESISPQNDSALNLDLCSDDQREALIAAISSPARGPPFLITGPFGSGKTRLLALVSRYLFSVHDKCTRILVCTQQQVSADAFLECYKDLTEIKDESLKVIRAVPDHFFGDNPDITYTKLHQFSVIKNDIQRRSKVLMIMTCSTAYTMIQHHHLPSGYFTHILIDEAAQMREPEAVGPLCFASVGTKIILAGDQHQVGPALLVLGEQAQKNGLAMSLMERLLSLYTGSLQGEALHYHRALTTSHRCERAILKLSEKLFYRTVLTPSLESHPNAQFALQFVCSSVENTLKPLETGTVYPTEAAVVVEQVRKWTTVWPKNIWGKKDFKEIAIASPTRPQLHEIKTLFSREGLEEKFQDIQRSPTYDIQGKDYRVVILSTSEPTNADGSARDPTKSICDPLVFNTVISRARSLIVCIGNPYVLLRKEQHMVRQYGEKAKCWSNYLKLCLENKTFSVSSEIASTKEEVEWMCSPLPSIVDHFVGMQQPEELADSKG